MSDPQDPPRPTSDKVLISTVAGITATVLLAAVGLRPEPTPTPPDTGSLVRDAGPDAASPEPGCPGAQTMLSNGACDDPE